MADRLASLKVPELKVLSKTMGVSNSGRKQDLIHRIVAKCVSYQTLVASGAMSDAQSQFQSMQMENAYREMAGLLRANTMPYHHQHPPMPIAMPNSNLHMMKPPQYVQQRGNVGWNNGVAPPAPVAAPVAHHHNHHQPIPFPRGNQLQDISVGLAPDLDGARCLCPIKASRGSTVTKCAACGFSVHAKCHQTQMVEEWHCEKCRSIVFEPFMRVDHTFGEPQFFRFSGASRQHIVYVIRDDELAVMRQRKGTQPGNLELQLRCFSMKESISEGHCWPTCCTVNVNGNPAQVIQRAVPGQTNTSKVLREQPLNLLQFSRPGRNLIEIRTADTLPMLYVFLIQRVERQALETLVDVVIANSTPITYDQAKADVIKSFGDEDDDDIVATCTMLSLRCPLGLCVIELPARGIHCKHLQCFDLKTFLMFNRSARSRAWKCIVCHKFIALAELRIDPYLKKLLRDVADDDELEEVEIFPDASWKKRVVEDEKEEKKPKVEAIEMPAVHGSAISVIDILQPLPAVSPPPPLGQLDSIDLTLSSDEEEDRPLIDLVPAPLPAMHHLWPSPVRAPAAAPGARASNHFNGGTGGAWGHAGAFGGMLDSTYDDPWHPSSSNDTQTRLNALAAASSSSDFQMLPPVSAPPSSSLAGGTRGGFPFAPLTAYIGNNTSNAALQDAASPDGPLPWPASHGIPAKARKRLHRGDEVRDLSGFSSSGSNSSSSSSSSTLVQPTRSAMTMPPPAMVPSNVIYLDDSE
ncbi:Aste57867_23638 [Aphanomyces stellatus]|uniref:Aste57867_23638 protein n=1 Tax=Aphanomyces stellatus TaxID=120398 RepID=A0A485LNC0_9STRA|nr:hypothetical protein As57867_023566 [Aphanomyces stellatus]VFU00283.1 Aste57867_23638 [Aphanomyces stellatus]